MAIDWIGMLYVSLDYAIFSIAAVALFLVVYTAVVVMFPGELDE